MSPLKMLIYDRIMQKHTLKGAFIHENFAVPVFMWGGVQYIWKPQAKEVTQANTVVKIFPELSPGGVYSYRITIPLYQGRGEGEIQ